MMTDGNPPPPQNIIRLLRTLHNIFLHEKRQGFAPTPGDRPWAFVQFQTREIFT